MRKKTTLGGDMVRLTVSKILMLCITMATSMLLARFRTLEEYGTYSQLLLVVNLFSSIFMLGLPNSINYFLARAESQKERQRFLSVYYTAATVLSIILGAVLVGCVPLIEGYFKNPTIKSFIYFLAAYPWASIISSTIENVLVVYQKTKFLMLYRLLNASILLGIVVAIQLLGFGFQEYMICNLVVHMIFALSVYVIVSRLSGHIRVLFDKSLLKQILIFSLPLGLASIIGTLDIEMDKLLIGRLMSTEDLAIYTNAAKELPLTVVSTSITAVLLPQLTRMIKARRTEDAVKLWGTATELSLIFMGLFVVGIFTYAEEVVEILYSSKYLAGVTVFRVYALVLLLRITYFGIVLNALGRTKEIMISSVMALGLNVVLNPLLYRFCGMVGPAIATFISIAIVLLFQLFLTAKHTGMSFRQVFPWLNLWKIVVCNVAFGIVFYAVKQLLPLDILFSNVTEAITLGVMWGGVYLLLMRKRLTLLWHKLNNM